MHIDYDTGWYCFAPANNITKGKIHSFNYFDTAFVCVRDSKNIVNVFDAYCPHMGAHLGVGGKMIADQIVCPFHGWQYNTAGDCVAIPYCDAIPKRAKLRRFLVREINSFIYIYYHREGINAEPDLPTALTEYQFNLVDSLHLPTQRAQKIIASYDFQSCGPGLWFNQAMLLAVTPINNETVQLTLSAAQKTNFLSTYLHKRKLQQLLNKDCA